MMGVGVYWSGGYLIGRACPFSSAREFQTGVFVLFVGPGSRLLSLSRRRSFAPFSLLPFSSPLPPTTITANSPSSH